jgi:hypothetical protein
MTETLKNHILVHDNHDNKTVVFCTESTWSPWDVHTGDAKAYICYNGTSTVYVCAESCEGDAWDTFADHGALNTQGPLDTADIEELWQEHPEEGPAAAGYICVGNASEYFNASYLHVKEAKVAFCILHVYPNDPS